MLYKSKLEDNLKNHAKETPEKIAIARGKREMTYSTLNSTANRFAHFLLENGVKKNDTVAIAGELSLETIVGIIGTIKSGCSIIPIDVTLPERKISSIIKRSGADCFLTSKDTVYHYKGKSLDITNAAISTYSNEEVETGLDNDSPLFITYLSDTTGEMEGRLLFYSNFLNWINFNINTLKINFENTLYIYNKGFEGIFPLWLAVLYSGGKVHFYKAPDTDISFGFGELMENGNDNFKCTVMPLYVVKNLISNNLVEKLFENQTHIVSMGEDLFHIESFKQFVSRKSIKWYNYYDFPDIQFITTIRTSREETGEYFHIGKPVINTNPYILDTFKNLVSIGMDGNLYLSGNGIINGIHKNPALHKERFCENPFKEKTEMFKTGLQVTYNPDRLISIKGRSDGRITINGRKISLLEIKSLICRYPHIDECLVIYERHGTSGKIKSYIGTQIHNLDIQELEEYLKEYLPNKIFPVGFVVLPSLPRNEKGRIDEELIKGLYYLDNNEIASLENDLKESNNIGNVAILTGGEKEKETYISVKDILLDPKKNKIPISAPVKKVGEKEIDRQHTPMAVSENKAAAIDENAPKTLTEALLKTASCKKNIGITYVNANGRDTFQHYDTLCRLAKSILTGLQNAGLHPGDKVILQINELYDFYPAFWACILGGIIPVTIAVAPSYKEKNSVVNKLYNVWNLLEKPAILASEHLITPLVELKTILPFEDVNVMSVSELKKQNPTPAVYSAKPEDIAFFQLSSGSTGIPKCIMVTHRGIVAHILNSKQANNYKDSDITLSWLPVDHVGTLIMLHAKDVYLGYKEIQAKTADIIAQPLLWFDLIEKYKVTHSWAPNFAFNLINKQIQKNRDKKWDLSSVIYIVNGGEELILRTLEEFVALTTPFGLRAGAIQPAFGMAEVCSAMTYNNDFDLSRSVYFIKKTSLSGKLIKTNPDDENSISFIDLGKPIGSVSIRIVDEENNLLPEGYIGRFQIKGNVVNPGYYKNPKANKESFLTDGWFNTGDLGFILDGRLVVTGREKEMLIINGVNYYCHEIEDVVDGIPGVTPTFAAASSFHDPDTGTEALSIFFSPEENNHDNILHSIRAIQNEVTSKIGIYPSIVVPIEKKDFPKTTSGKIQRTKLKNNLAGGYYEPVLREFNMLQEKDRLFHWFYEKKWYREEIDPFALQKESATYLIFSDKTGLGEKVIQRLKESDNTFFWVDNGNGFHKQSDNHFQINRADQTDYRKLFNSLKKENVAVHKIIHLWTYEDSKEIDDIPSLKNSQYRGFYSLLFLIQALKEYQADKNHLMNVFVISSHSQPVREGEVVEFQKSTMHGLLRSLPLEIPTIKYRFIDLDTNEKSKNITHIYNELLCKNSRPEIAYRNGKRYALYLSQFDFEKQKPGDFYITQGGLYIVTGGLGGVGFLISRWLIKNYNARVIIIGRTELPDKKLWDDILSDNTTVAKRIRAFKKLESEGGDFIYKSGTVSDENFLTDCIRKGKEKYSLPVSGVFHLAGDISKVGNKGKTHWEEMEDHLIENEKEESCEFVFASKVYGTMSLHNVLKNEKDLLFVVFSSVNSFFGGTSLSTYSAANSFLDNFIFYRRSKNFNKSYCINFSMWENTGMSSNIPDHIKTISGAGGYAMISESEGIKSLHLILCYDKPQIFVGINGLNKNMKKYIKHPFNKNQILDIYYSLKNKTGFFESRFLNIIKQAVNRMHSTQNIQVNTYKLDKIPMKNHLLVDREKLSEIAKTVTFKDYKSDQPKNEIEKKIFTIIKEIVEKSNIGVNDDIFAMGFNSIMITQLIYELKIYFKQDFVMSSLLQKPTIRGISEMIIIGKDKEEKEKKEEFEFEKEAVLDPAITPLSNVKENIESPTQVFLTGATGFVGAYLLYELINHTNALVHCLVRASTASEGLEKIKKNLKDYLIWNDAFTSRIVPIPGDMEKPEMGINEQDYNILVKKIDAIYHCGAKINWTQPYSSHKAANVTGTERILRFATTNKTKIIHYISTTAFLILAKPGEKDPDVILESRSPFECGSPYTGYTKSKWVAEGLLWLARDRGIPVVIYRISEIFGDTKGGVISQRDFIWRMMRGFIKLGNAPDVDMILTITPVDFIARAIIHISKQKDVIGKVFQVINPHYTHLRDLIRYVMDFGYDIEYIKYKDWQKKLLTELNKRKYRDTLYPLLAVFPEVLFSEEESELTLPDFDFTNCTRALEGESIICPEISFELISKYISAFIKKGYLEEPGKLNANRK